MREVTTGNGKILRAYGLEGSGYSLPAEQVGGDFFEFIFCDERTVFAAIGDVMGKGFHAARLMETIRHMLLPTLFDRQLSTIIGHWIRIYLKYKKVNYSAGGYPPGHSSKTFCISLAADLHG